MSAEIWSGSDFPYMCLKDRARTEAFRRAIAATVTAGDVVVDAGAGTGILSFFAAAAGAGRVYAVEIDPVMCARLRTSVALNGLGDVVTVIAGDAAQVPLPRGVDVFIGELIDTGLMEEMQVAVINALARRGVIGPATRMVPETYTTRAELVAIEDTYYGFRIAAPKHEWPFYAHAGTGWHHNPVVALTEPAALGSVSFGAPLPLDVRRTVAVRGLRDGTANGLRLSGRLQLAPGICLGATNALNGDKILHLDRAVPIVAGDRLTLDVSYAHGGGLASFRCGVGARRDADRPETPPTMPGPRILAPTGLVAQGGSAE